MAITTDTLRLTRDLRLELDDLVNGETRLQVQSWARAWDEIAAEMQAAVQDLLAVGDGQWPTRAQINRATRAQAALALARERLDTLAAQAGVRIVDTAGQATDLGSAGQPRVIVSQLPPAAGEQAALVARFDRVSREALDAIVARSTEQITALTQPLSTEATEAMRRTLVRGVAVGDNPRRAAATMLRRLEGGFNGGLTRALTIARTEMLDAHRAGAAAQQSANADVLAGWVWHAQLDRRTCPSCFAQHGQLHPLDDPGPLDHQQGRCARTPKTRSWREFGFNIDEPPDLMPDARRVFTDLDPADQLAIMGPRRLAALRRGDIAWADLSQRRSTDGWRDSFGVTPVRDLAAA